MIASGALHAVVAGALGWTLSARAPASPRGVHRAGDADVVEVGLVGHRARPRPTPHVASAQAPVPEPEPAATGQDAAAPAGFADGVKAEGRLGVADGFAASERERYLYELRVLLEGRKTYPKISRYMNESGRVTVRFVIHADGRIEGVEVAEASAFERLNHAARQLVTSLDRYKPFPRGIATASLNVELPIEYVLR